MNFQNCPYSDMDRSILAEEYIQFKSTVQSYNKQTPYYVYAICQPNELPFYIGKGKGNRAFDHIKNFLAGRSINQRLYEKIAELGPEPPIVFLFKGNLDQTSALNLEEKLISKYGRIGIDGILTNIMSSGNYSSSLMSQIGGKIGGKTTKSLQKGIFSPEWDRSAQSKLNWENGLLDHIDFNELSKKGGNAAVERQLGIHDPVNRHMRSEWASIGQQALQKAGTRGGYTSPEWRKKHSEEHFISSSKGGKNWKKESDNE